jgi:hypothetical protein
MLLAEPLYQLMLVKRDRGQYQRSNKAKMKNEVHVDFLITRFPRDPDEITKELGIQPTETWLKGDPVAISGEGRASNGWRLSSGLDKHAKFQEHIQALLAVIEPNIQRFVDIGSRFYTEISTAVYMYYHEDSPSSTPWVHLDKKATSVFKRIGAEVDINVYVLLSEFPEPDESGPYDW